MISYLKKVFGTDPIKDNTKSLEDVLMDLKNIDPKDSNAKNALQSLVNQNTQLRNNYVVLNIIGDIPYLLVYKPNQENIDTHKIHVNKAKDTIRLCIADLLEQNDDIQNIDIEKDLILSEKTKNTVKMLDKTLRAKDILQEYGVSLPTGIIFYGPPGVGKTECARWLSKSGNFHFVYVSMSDIVHGIVGTSEKAMTDIFQNARNQTIQSGKPTIIFIDESDKLLGDRRDQKHSLVQHFLSLVDGFYKNKGIIVILSTNVKEILDKAVWSRMVEKVEFPLPSEAEIKEIMHVHMFKGITDNTIQGLFSTFFIEYKEELSSICTKLYNNQASGRDIKHIIHTAKRDFALDTLDDTNKKFYIQYIQQSITKNMPDFTN